MPEPRVPTAIAMLICDQIISEAVTNKKSLIGIFDKIASPQFPVVLPRLAVYVKMADAEGDYQFRLRFVTLKDESLIQEFMFEIKIADGTQYSDFAVNIQGAMQFKEPGKYEFQLYWGDNFLHRIAVQAQQAQLPQA